MEIVMYLALVVVVGFVYRLTDHLQELELWRGHLRRPSRIDGAGILMLQNLLSALVAMVILVGIPAGLVWVWWHGLATAPFDIGLGWVVIIVGLIALFGGMSITMVHYHQTSLALQDELFDRDDRIAEQEEEVSMLESEIEGLKGAV